MKVVKWVTAISICMAVAVTVIVLNWSRGEGAVTEETDVASGTSTVSGSRDRKSVV